MTRYTECRHCGYPIRIVFHQDEGYVLLDDIPMEEFPPEHKCGRDPRRIEDPSDDFFNTIGVESMMAELAAKSPASLLPQFSHGLMRIFDPMKRGNS